MNGIFGITAAVAALVAAIGTFINARHIKDVKTEVKTANSLSMAQLADAQETRRIDKIPVGKQTEGEKTHLAEVPKK